MWVLLAGILMCYMLGFLLYCCYNSRRTSSRSGDVENPSAGSPLSALRTNANNANTNTNGNGSSQSQCRFGLGFGLRLLPTPFSCLYDEITQRNSDLPQSALTAQREQQLRQIKLEINELSCRLGIGQLYRERQFYLQNHNYVQVPLTLTTRDTFIQPGRRSRSGSCGNGNIMPPSRGPRDPRDTNVISDEGSSSPSSEVSSLEMNFSSSLPPSSSTSDTFPLGQTFLVRNGIFLQRQRRLRLIRMEIQDLTLQLSNLSQDRSTSENNAGGCSISSSDLEGLVFEPDSDEENDGGLTLNSSSYSYQLDELPSYDESIIVSVVNESPPPSYAQCTGFLTSEEESENIECKFYSSKKDNEEPR